MKVCSALAVASIATALTSANAASSLSGDADSAPWTEIAEGKKTYVTGVRATADGGNFCGGALISPSHVLTTTACITNNIRWVSIGSRSYTGVDDGEQIKVVSFIPHPNNTDYSSDFLILELEVESSITPVKMDSATKSVVKPGLAAGRLGWNDTTAEAVQSRYMQSVEQQLIDNEQCAEDLTVDDTNLCTRGVTNIKSCLGDYGGPLVVQSKKGDVLVGLVSSNEECKQAGLPSVFSRVSSARKWIDSVIKNVCMA